MRSSRSKPKPRLQSWLPNHSDLEQYRRTATEDYGGVGFCGRSRPAELEGGVVWMTCQHFIYGVDQHCVTMVGCNLRQKQLQQGQHLKKRCKLWAPTWQQEMGWAPEAG